MKSGVLSLLALVSLGLPACSQSSETYRGLLTPEVRSGTLSSPKRLDDYVKDGKLRLSLDETIRLALENNTSVRIEETQIEAQKFTLLGAHSRFDPSLAVVANANRYSTPGNSELQGIGQSSSAAQNSLTQLGQIGYTQLFPTGTLFAGTITSTKNSNNSSFYFFNPYFSSTLNFQVTQPLLRNFGLFVNRAPIVIARRSLLQSQAGFEAEVNDAIFQAVTQYWAVVQARDSLKVEQDSLSLAEASYQRDQRALELGALPPLDIYRSQSEVAARRLQAIQGEYALKQVEEDLRLTIGANQSPSVHALEFDLTELSEPAGELDPVTVDDALQKALAARPEVDAADYALKNDDTSIRVAHNRLLPDLSFNGFYQSSGQGGNQYNLNTGALISQGGLGSSLGQMGGFGFPGYGGSLTLNLPIRNRAAQANLGAALVSRQHDLYAARQTHETITLQVTDAVHQLEEAKLTLEAGKASHDLAQKTLSAEQRKYELGAETNFFVLDAQSRLAQADLDLLQTEIGYQLARAAVDHATGDLLKQYDVQIKTLTK